jgi:hypothetical protein
LNLVSVAAAGVGVTSRHAASRVTSFTRHRFTRPVSAIIPFALPR